MILDRIATVLDHILNTFIVIICVIATLVGSYTFYDYLSHNDISFLSNRNDSLVSSEDVFIEKQIGWIMIDNTNINYPLMQGKDNVEYLDKDPYGKENTSGSIFLEWSNDAQLRDDFSVIYGQHAIADLMFGDLDRYLDRNYFDTHQSGTIKTSDHKYKFKVFAVYKAEASDGFIFNPAIRTVDSICNYIKKRADIYEAPDSDCRIVALSTCSKENEMFRVVVFGTISE